MNRIGIDVKKQSKAQSDWCLFLLNMKKKKDAVSRNHFEQSEKGLKSVMAS